MKIYHFTDKEIDNVSVDHFGENWHTNNDFKISKVKRSFFYLEPKAFEHRFFNKKCYVGEVQENQLYDLNRDHKHVTKGFDNIDDMLTYLKSHYKGVIYNVSFDICIMFEDVKVEKIEI